LQPGSQSDLPATLVTPTVQSPVLIYHDQKSIRIENSAQDLESKTEEDRLILDAVICGIEAMNLSPLSAGATLDQRCLPIIEPFRRGIGRPSSAALGSRHLHRMKTVEVHNSFGIDSLRMTDRPQPQPGPGEVLVRVNSVSLNYRDLMVVNGVFFPDLSFPFIPASDASGDVVAVGERVTGFKKGDRVTTQFIPDWERGPFEQDYLGEKYLATSLGVPGPGTFTEYLSLPPRALVHTPAYLTDDEASTLPIAAVSAWRALTLKPLQEGQTLLVQGTGGVSIFALQFAKLFGANVIILSSSDDKLVRAKKLGADATINYRKNPVWWEQVRELCGGHGVDHVVDVGGPGTLDQSIKALKGGGFIAVVGLLGGTETTIDQLTFIVRNARIESFTVGSRESFEKMNEFLVANELHPVVDTVFPWNQAADAFRQLEAGKHFGKIVLRRE
jgi:NADPH:quinone reductase-like Zn-dependent oxidoreductase